MTQPSLFDAAQPAAVSRQLGMDRALAGAERQHEDWGELAFRFLVAFARRRASFMGWECVRAAEACSNVPIANPKAWGAIFARAARDGYISKDGYEPDPNRNQNPAPRWRSRCYAGV